MFIYKPYSENGVMTNNIELKNKDIYEKIKTISNPYRFRILELTQENAIGVTKLSSMTKLSYTKCSDYIRVLEKQNLISKAKTGKSVQIKSKTCINEKGVFFSA